MDEHFTTQAIAQTFGVSHQTVKNWSDEFVDFLSPTANPGQGRRRLFTPEDLRVFALVHDFHKRGYTYADAKGALGAGQRGDIPDTSATPPTVPAALIVQLRDEITDIRLKLRTTEVERDEAQGQVKILRELLKEQLADKERQIRELIEENARLKADQKD